MGNNEFLLLKKFLDDNGVVYRVYEHEPVYTSEQAARVRRVELKTGVKALIIKTPDERFILGLVAADRKIDLAKLAKIVGVKKLKLATPIEVLEKTGCEIGSVHPFGNLYNLQTYLDRSVLENTWVNFNAGLHTVSIHMKTEDLVRLVKPVIADFSKE
ncbi:MAG: YbaK/EbsC family protein [Nitrososphaerota archaeon]